MSYTNSADIYLGDISSQVYEFIRQPKPCLFFNLDRIAWREHGGFAHWHLGQVVERLTDRSEEHTSELQSLMRISYAVFCLKKKTQKTNQLTKYHEYGKRLHK